MKVAGAADHEQAHEFTPVVGVLAFLEGGEAVDGALVFLGELLDAVVALTADIFLGPETERLVGVQEQAELVGEVEIGFVVGRGREKDAAAAVALDGNPASTA